MNSGQINWQTSEQKNPLVQLVQFEPNSRLLVITLKSAAILKIPVDLIQGLQLLPNNEISNFHVNADSASIHWEEARVHLTIKALVAGIVGDDAWMEHLQEKHPDELARVELIQTQDIGDKQYDGLGSYELETP